MSVVVLAVVALVWYLMRFKHVQRLSALHLAALDNMENAVLLADPRG
ncbi:MAG: hypothetical protein ACKVHX_05675 [Alphaproteobacteria bacterium]